MTLTTQMRVGFC